jgi:quercetin dioxygenase-like cupin family protein
MDSGVLRAGEGRSIWVVGDRYTIKASGEDTGGAFALIEALVTPGGGPPPHIRRREDEAFYVLEGELHFHTDGRDIAVGAGSWITLAKGSLHHFKNLGLPSSQLGQADIGLLPLGQNASVKIGLI